MLHWLRAISGGVSEEGTETVGGIQTTHYRAEVSLDRLPSALGAASPESIRQSFAALEKLAHVKQIPIDVWVDGNHLVRRERIALSEHDATGGAMNMVITVEFTAYGPQPEPALPPANQVTDLSSLMGAAG